MSFLQLLSKQTCMIHRNILCRSFKIPALLNNSTKFNLPQRDSCFHVVRCLSNYRAGMDCQEKTLCIKDYDAIGFDIDHTLAKYNIPNLFDVSIIVLFCFCVLAVSDN